MLTGEQVQALLANTDSLINHVHHFTHELERPPGAYHRGTAINTVDLAEKREDFLRELRNTVNNWVYSKSRYTDLFNEALQERGYDIQNAASHIEWLARSKFRRGHPQGQFGELLLFNFLQFFYNAPPILRKMPLTTNPALERNGADAIHYAPQNGDNIIYLGEAKTYTADYRFNVAFSESLSSILGAYRDINNEIGLYVYDDFIEPPLREVARLLKTGQLSNTRYELVCLIAYAETNAKEAENETAIKSKIESIVEQRLHSADCRVLDGVPEALVSRLHYIIFPIWDFPTLISSFDS